MARMKELTLHNPLTGTTMTGCVSDEARDFLKSQEPSCSQARAMPPQRYRYARPRHHYIPALSLYHLYNPFA